MPYKPRNPKAKKWAGKRKEIDKEFQSLIGKYPELGEFQSAFNGYADDVLQQLDRLEDLARKAGRSGGKYDKT